jgi:exopolysaccharide biosynthesis polyprenyl glycosylphosphotransferase
MGAGGVGRMAVAWDAYACIGRRRAMSVRVSAPSRLKRPAAEMEPVELPFRVNLPAFHTAERKLLLATMDGLLVIAAAVATPPLQRAGLPAIGVRAWSPSWQWILAAAVTWVLLSWLAGAYDLSTADHFAGTAGTIAGVTFASGSLAALGFAVLGTPLRLSALGFALATTSIAVFAWRALYVWALSHRGSAIRLLMVGDAATYQELCRVVPAERYYLVVGFLAEQMEGSVGCLGELSNLVALAARMKVHRIVVSPHLRLTDELIAAVCHCAAQGISVMSVTAAYEEMAGKTPIEHPAVGPLLPVPLRSRGSGAEEAALRCLDLAGALTGLAVAAVLSPAIAVAIVVETGRPVLYRQERLGAGGKRFVMYKFRSMHCDAERQGPMFALVRDPRVTHVGKLLRQTHLDELPQFWNVLRGEMSLVGPRPERPEFDEQLAAAIPHYRLRLAVRPGLTGLTQIRVGYASTIGEHVEVLRHDLYYIGHRSLALNLSILARTVTTVVGRTGR